jgi:hypothetical protein
MKRRIFTIALCLVASSCLMLFSPIRRAIAQTTSNVVEDNSVAPPVTQVIQGARGSCTPGSGGNCTFTLNWPTAFASSTYTVNCYNLGGGHLMVEARTTTSVSLGFTEVPAQGSLEDDCIAVYP